MWRYARVSSAKSATIATINTVDTIDTIAMILGMDMDFDFELARTNHRRNREYSVWVKVTYSDPGQRQTYHQPYESPTIEADAWGSLGNPIELTDDELNGVLELMVQAHRDSYID